MTDSSKADCSCVFVVVEYSTMHIISHLPFDANQGQVLKSICEIEAMHRPVRRAEKKYLNEVHKQIKYKLEGPPSKVRVQQPWEKTFVLMQVSIGQIQIEDYTVRNPIMSYHNIVFHLFILVLLQLRQEMLAMTDTASRILNALEQYCAWASHSGQLARQALVLRRAIATSLWCSQNGVLGQFGNLSRETVAALRFNGISGFQDVMTLSEERIEHAANRKPPFGQNLLRAVRQTLSVSLKLSAKIEPARDASTPAELICHVDREDDLNPEQDTSAGGASDVVFTLLAYSDMTGGCLFMYKKNINSPGIHRCSLPPNHGSVSIHLVSSMVGLDGKLLLYNLSPSTTLVPLNFEQVLVSTEKAFETLEEQHVRDYRSSVLRVPQRKET